MFLHEYIGDYNFIGGIKMGQPQVQPVAQKGCTAVNFRNIENTKDNITYNIPIGTKITTTKKQYEVKPDGIYLGKQKLESLDLPLFDLAALKKFDIDGDKNIEFEDITKNNAIEKKGPSIADRINTRLDQLKSEYFIPVYEVDGGKIEHAAISEEYGFCAEFSHRKDYDLKKYFCVTLPGQKAP